MSPERPSLDEVAAEFRPGEIVLEIPARTEYVSLVRVVVAAAAEIEPDMASERLLFANYLWRETCSNSKVSKGLWMAA